MSFFRKKAHNWRTLHFELFIFGVMTITFIFLCEPEKREVEKSFAMGFLIIRMFFDRGIQLSELIGQQIRSWVTGSRGNLLIGNGRWVRTDQRPQAQWLSRKREEVRGSWHFFDLHQKWWVPTYYQPTRRLMLPTTGETRVLKIRLIITPLRLRALITFKDSLDAKCYCGNKKSRNFSQLLWSKCWVEKTKNF